MSEDNQNFNDYIDPKCQWAVGHLECFPVEIMTADYYTLLRVPGIGTNSVRRIIKSQKTCKAFVYRSKENGCRAQKSTVLYHL